MADKETLQTVRGMHDFLPGKAAQVSAIEIKAREIFAHFGFKEIRTPVMESIALFKRAIGETTDIVEKEMFTLQDRGERTLCLRPEGTAGVVRSYIENSLGRLSAVNKLYYVGPMFRAERPQAGRYREFIQIGGEHFGTAGPGADAEMIAVLLAILHRAGIETLQLQLNSIGDAQCRPQYQAKLLEYLRGKAKDLCYDCQKRLEKNPLRALDCKTDRDKLLDAPKSLENLCEPCQTHHDKVVSLLKSVQIPFVINHQLVRGLDYYSRTVFEVYATGKTGSQDALAAGGRYDALVEILGGDPTPAVGFALGVERVLNHLNELGKTPVGLEPKHKGVFVAWMGEPAKDEAFKLIHELRKNEIPASMALTEQSFKSQMRMAGNSGLPLCIVIGDDEIRDNQFTLKNFADQSQIKLPREEIIPHLKSL